MSMWEALIRPPVVRGANNQPLQFTRGQRVGEWTLIDYRPGQKQPRVAPAWRCRCSCGVERYVQASNLAAGASLSCGHATGGRPPAAARIVRPH